MALHSGSTNEAGGWGQLVDHVLTYDFRSAILFAVMFVPYLIWTILSALVVAGVDGAAFASVVTWYYTSVPGWALNAISYAYLLLILIIAVRCFNVDRTEVTKATIWMFIGILVVGFPPIVLVASKGNFWGEVLSDSITFFSKVPQSLLIALGLSYVVSSKRWSLLEFTLFCVVGIAIVFVTTANSVIFGAPLTSDVVGRVVLQALYVPVYLYAVRFVLTSINPSHRILPIFVIIGSIVACASFAAAVVRFPDVFFSGAAGTWNVYVSQFEIAIFSLLFFVLCGALIRQYLLSSHSIIRWVRDL